MARHTEDYTKNEAVAAFISRSLEDGMIAYGALAEAALRAGVLLAHLTHAPNLTTWPSMTVANLSHLPELHLTEGTIDWRAAQWSEAYRVFGEINTEMKLQRKRYYGVGGLQVDKYGNCNLIGIGKDYKHLQVRGAGSIGGPSFTHFCKYFDIYVRSHQKRTFVEKCDYISDFGWGQGGADARKKLGIRGGGPRYVFTTLCIMDFEENTKRMRLKYVHRGASVQDVVDNTGFELIIPEKVGLVPAPTKEELEVLRTRIDTDGLLRSTNELL